MRTVAQGESFNIYYNVRGLPTNKTVLTNIWDGNGISLVTDQSLTEIPNDLGTYYWNYTAPSQDTYLCILCYYADRTHAASQVVQVGSPTTRAYYCDLNLNTDRNVAYSIQEYDGTEVESGTLISLGNAFYYTQTSVTPPYYFRVPPYVTLKED